MSASARSPLVHLELHTPDASAASAFYSELCGWLPQRVETRHGSYLALGIHESVGGGVVESPLARPLWLPYVEVTDVGAITERANELGARVVLSPREGPAGWRSVITTPCGAELAFWQHKR